MNTTYGLRGSIVPAGPFKDQEDSFTFGSFQMAVKDGVIEIGFDDQGEGERAREIVRQYLDWFSAAHGVRHTADLNQSWEMKPGGTKTVGLEVGDTVTVTDDVRVTQVTIQGRARIVTEAYDSSKLSTYSAQVQKSQKSAALADALRYFNDEAVDAERPLYGLYKAVEALAGALPGGRAELGILAGCGNKKDGKRYVDDIMQTSGLTRHHNDPDARQVLTDEECKERAKLLIMAYAGAPPAAPSAASAGSVSAVGLDIPWAVGEKQVFCAACEVMTTQKLVLDRNKEIVTTCPCGRQLKFPLTDTEEQLGTVLAAHRAANER